MSVVAHPTLGAEVRRLRALYGLLATLTHAKTPREVYDCALTGLLEATCADRAAILLFEDDGVIRFQAWRGLSEEYRLAVTGHCPWKQGERDARAFAVADVSAAPELQPYQKVLEREGIRALGFVPLALGAGVMGKFMLYYAEPHECAADELEVAQAIATHVALAADRKRAEMERAHIEQRMQAILDNSAAPIWVKDVQGRYELINRRYSELFHIPAEKALGKTDYDLFPVELADRFIANDRVVIASGKAIAVEEAAPQEDGLHTYVSVKFPMEGPDGRMTGVCGIATDISDRKELEMAGQRLAAIVESSDDAIISKDLQGIITTWNNAAERMFGYTAAEVVGKPVSVLAAPGHQNEMPAILAEIRQGLRVEHFETRRRRKDGEIIEVALTVSPVRNAAGEIVGASKIARDITDRKRAEQERAELLLREQEARRTAELLNRVAPRLAAQLDLEKLVQEVIDLAAALVGAEFGSFFHNAVNDKGEPCTVYKVSGPGKEAFESYPQASFPGHGPLRSEDVMLDPAYGPATPDGMPKGQAVRSYLAVPVTARSGELLGGLFFGHATAGKFTRQQEEIAIGIAAQAAIAMDNARLFEQARRIQAELQRSNDQLQRANRDLEVFAYSASHDLQEPIRTIALSAHLLDRSVGRQLQGDDALFLGNVMAAADRMGRLTEDLLTYMRAATHETGSAPGVDSGKVLHDVLQSLNAQIEETGAVVTADELPVAAMHESRLAQVFQNLISNAIKYRRDEAPRIHISAQEREEWQVFSIRDNGIGVDRQFAEQIFGLFKRLHGRSEYPGSGIGLAICQRVVEQYGGRIWLEESVLGQGSTFCFALPIG